MPIAITSEPGEDCGQWKMEKIFIIKLNRSPDNEAKIIVCLASEYLESGCAPTDSVYLCKE